MLEKRIEQRLRDRIKALGGLCLKWEAPGYTGVPDRLILLPGGYVVMVETKAPGRTERARQAAVQDKLRAMGFLVYGGIDSAEKVDRIVDCCRALMGESGNGV